MNEMLWPAAMVKGKEAPFKANWGLLLVPEEMVTLDPTALKVRDRVAMVPSATLPKFSAAGATVNCPGAGAVPVPVSGSGVPEPDALLANEREPETVPLLLGVKATLNETLLPAAIVKGKEAPFMTNCGLLLALEETVTLEPTALKLMD